MKRIACAATAAACLFLVSACDPSGSLVFDHDNDPNTPAITLTKEQRCTWYTMRLEQFAADGETSSYEAIWTPIYEVGKAETCTGTDPVPLPE